MLTQESDAPFLGRTNQRLVESPLTRHTLFVLEELIHEGRLPLILEVILVILDSLPWMAIASKPSAGGGEATTASLGGEFRR